MKSEPKLDNELKEKIISFLRKYDAERISIFGSYVRGEATPESDIDIIVEFKDVKGLITFIEIQEELSEAINIKVDLLTKEEISPYLIKRIKKEALVIYK